jgi:hypothetical protein
MQQARPYPAAAGDDVPLIVIVLVVITLRV